MCYFLQAYCILSVCFTVKITEIGKISSPQEQRKRLITEQKAQLLAAHNAVASSLSPIAVRSAVSSIGAMQVPLEIRDQKLEPSVPSPK